SALQTAACLIFVIAAAGPMASAQSARGLLGRYDNVADSEIPTGTGSSEYLQLPLLGVGVDVRQQVAGGPLVLPQHQHPFGLDLAGADPWRMEDAGVAQQMRPVLVAQADEARDPVIARDNPERRSPGGAVPDAGHALCDLGSRP